MIRWLTVVLGVGVTVAALHALLSAPGTPRARRATPAVSAPAPPAHAAPLHEIDDASRARLERVLRKAERKASR